MYPRKFRWICGVFLAVCAAGLLWLTVFRAGFSFERLFQNGTLILTPFSGMLDLVRYTAPLTALYLIGGNIAWFVPVGLLLPVVTDGKLRFWHCLLCGTALSVLIEFLQYMFGVGITEIDDLILNTLGAALGYGLYALVKKLFHK